MGRMVIASLVVLMAAKGVAGELDYIIVDRMPAVRGDLERSISATDEARGVHVTQDRFNEDFDHAWIQTFVSSAQCLESMSGTSAEPYLLAIKYPPKKPATFAIAGLHDMYKDVYVRDQGGKIRLYENVDARSMIELSEAFLPRCIES